MTIIHVPRPKNAFNPNRPVSGLLKAQTEYLHEAEKRLPLRYQSGIYVNAIRTEDEAAKYIRHVTEAIHEAHADAASARARVAPKRRPVISLAAVADERAEKKRASRGRKSTGKKSGGKSGARK
jgi:hypothetical protein